MTLGVAPSSKTPTIKAVQLHVSIVLFSGSSLVFFLTLYILLPRLRAENMSWFTIYNLVLVLPMLALVGAALIGYKSEGHPFVWSLLQSRLRLKGMNTFLIGRFHAARLSRPPSSSLIFCKRCSLSSYRSRFSNSPLRYGISPRWAVAI